MTVWFNIKTLNNNNISLNRKLLYAYVEKVRNALFWINSEWDKRVGPETYFTRSIAFFSSTMRSSRKRYSKWRHSYKCLYFMDVLQQLFGSRLHRWLQTGLLLDWLGTEPSCFRTSDGSRNWSCCSNQFEAVLNIPNSCPGYDYQWQRWATEWSLGHN